MLNWNMNVVRNVVLEKIKRRRRKRRRICHVKIFFVKLSQKLAHLHRIG